MDAETANFLRYVLDGVLVPLIVYAIREGKRAGACVDRRFRRIETKLGIADKDDNDA